MGLILGSDHAHAKVWVCIEIKKMKKPRKYDQSKLIFQQTHFLGNAKKCLELVSQTFTWPADFFLRWFFFPLFLIVRLKNDIFSKKHWTHGGFWLLLSWLKNIPPTERFQNGFCWVWDSFFPRHWKIKKRNFHCDYVN